MQTSETWIFFNVLFNYLLTITKHFIMHLCDIKSSIAPNSSLLQSYHNLSCVIHGRRGSPFYKAKGVKVGDFAPDWRCQAPAHTICLAPGFLSNQEKLPLQFCLSLKMITPLEQRPLTYPQASSLELYYRHQRSLIQTSQKLSAHEAICGAYVAFLINRTVL